MAIGANIQAWRMARGQSVAALAEKAGLDPACVETIETGEYDPPASTLIAVAEAIGIPPSWLYGDPRHLDLLTGGEEEAETPSSDSVDPILERILLSTGQARDLYVLLAALIQSGDSKLLRAAEVNLRSLVKQSKGAAVPWQARPPGHFEPPSD